MGMLSWSVLLAPILLTKAFCGPSAVSNVACNGGTEGGMGKLLDWVAPAT